MVEPAWKNPGQARPTTPYADLAGGFLIGVPVVFTVDSWWLGDQLTPANALFLIAFAYLLTSPSSIGVGFERCQGLVAPPGRCAGGLALAIFTLFLVFGSLGQIFDGQPAFVDSRPHRRCAAPLSLVLPWRTISCPAAHRDSDATWNVKMTRP